MRPTLALSCIYLSVVIACGRPPDNPTAAEIRAEAARLEAACDSSDIQACFDLANMHWSGVTTPQNDGLKGWNAFAKALAIDETRAVQLQEAACKKKQAAGCSNLAIMYYNGFVFDKNLETAAELWQQACDRGLMLACQYLGEMYVQGEGVIEERPSLAG